jgi:dolichyl-phosphate beta-glucosyltransferase
MSNEIQPLLSLVIPAYNEQNRLPVTFQQIREHITRWAFPFELIVVVEPSQDRTLKLAREEARSLPNLVVLTDSKRRGKGFAVRSGMLQAHGSYIFFSDADLSTPLEDLDKALALLQHDQSIDVLVGNRQHPNSQIVQYQSMMRECMGKVFNRMVRALAGLNLSDTQCGFKGFRHRAAKEIFGRQRTDGFSFDVEVLLLAKAMNFSVVETPVRWKNSPVSHVRIVEDSLRMLRDVAGVRKLVQDTMHKFPYHWSGENFS